jgi:hypothetical protein
LALPKNISIQQLKGRPRLGNKFKKTKQDLEALKNSGAIKDLQDEIDNFSNTLPSLSVQLSGMKDLLKGTIDEFAALSAGVGRAQAYFQDYSKAANKAIENLSFLIETQKDLQKSFKLSSAGGFDFTKRLRQINVEVGDAKLFKYAEGLKAITGGFITSNKISQKNLANLTLTQEALQNNLGLSEEGAQKFELFSRSIGKSGAESLRNISMAAEQFAAATGQDQTQVMSQMVEDISKMGTDVATQFGRVPGQLEAATMKARLLGTSMEELSGVGEKLLNIESSIGTEMELQQLTGKRLLTDQGKSLTNEFRMAQLQGNGVKQAELMQQFLEQQGDDLENNFLARQKASELFGIDGAKLLEMNAQLKLQKQLGVENIVAQAGQDLDKLEADLRAKGTLKDEEVEKVLAGVKKSQDVRTPAERSADSLERLESLIALQGQGVQRTEGVDAQGNAIFKYIETQTIAGKDFVNTIEKSITEGPMKFVGEAAKTFSDPSFINTVGKMGILADRTQQALVPLSQFNEATNNLIKPLQSLEATITSLTKVIKDPKAEVKVSTGGYISGPGTGTSDSIPARLSDGEYVINAAATKRYKPLLDKINSGTVKMANGGMAMSTSKMESLLASMLTLMRGNGAMGETSMNSRKRV